MEAVPLKPEVLCHVGKLAVTNSMVVTWVVALGNSSSLHGSRRAMSSPSRPVAQNFWEWLVESLYNFLESMIGAELVKKTFWFFATIFIFILFA